MPRDPLRLALAQSPSVAGDVSANASAAGKTIIAAAARGAHLVVFPELYITGYELQHLAANPDAWLEGEGDVRLDPVRQACAAHHVFAILGAPVRNTAGEHFIAAPILGPHGDVGLSVKEHLHGSEQAFFRAGAPEPPFEVHGWRVAMGICFDVAHPRHAEHAALEGADLYVASSLYWVGEERRVDLHLGARAMDNRMFTGLANYAGTTGGHVSCGSSGAWGPTGDVLDRVDTAGEALLVVELDPKKLEPYRKSK